MNKIYLDYNIIPIGDHCAVSMILNDLKLRNKSYPFDWNAHVDPYNTNIIHNIELINQLKFQTTENIVKNYIGNAFENNNSKTNTLNNIVFPHDNEEITAIFTKYERRLKRLKEDLNKKNIFILVTRFYYIDEIIFNIIIKTLLDYNSSSIILFISGINHEYFKNKEYKNIIFKHIYYDISQFYNYDYTDFRPNLTKYLSDLLCESKN